MSKVLPSVKAMLRDDSLTKKIQIVLCLLALTASCSGCSLATTAVRNIWIEMKDHADDSRERTSIQQAAKLAATEGRTGSRHPEASALAQERSAAWERGAVREDRATDIGPQQRRGLGSTAEQVLPQPRRLGTEVKDDKQ